MQTINIFNRTKKILKKIIGRKLLAIYHLLMARAAALYYANPSNKLIVIGVTGTNGKTATVNFISKYLDCIEQKNGLTSTANFKIDQQEWLNDKKMTMLGRWQTQELLSKMVKAGCKYAIIETSSQGIEQFRHIGINYDLIVFTNLTPEHIEAHGGFQNYRRSKEKLFYHLANSKRKNLNNQRIFKTIISNNDDEETERLRKIKVDKFITYSISGKSDYQAQDIDLKGGISFSIKNNRVRTDLIGRFNVYNVLAAILAVQEFGFTLGQLKTCQLKGALGRQEWIEQGQNFKVLVDYAPEPVGLEQLYRSLETISKNRLIHILGSCGGGRDKARQPILGNMAGRQADIVIVTNEDPYDDDPQEIINNVAQGAIDVGKEENKNLFKILNRAEAIKKAISLAQENDLILITGKGSEQFICGPDGHKTPWDDREKFKELL